MSAPVLPRTHATAVQMLAVTDSVYTVISSVLAYRFYSEEMR